MWGNPGRTADELRALSPNDAAAYPTFDRRVRTISSFLAYLNAQAPQAIHSPSFSDALAGLKLGRAFRRLGPRAGRETLRVLPMAVADLVGEMFERDEVRGALAARAVQFTAMGPWTAGTAAKSIRSILPRNANRCPLPRSISHPGSVSPSPPNDSSTARGSKP